ncbi:putative glutamine amidotransferase [Pullulanibacillus pueri]|uniref:Peptidase C26 n=1 Tax=Pullulanibacillus pueri TaxID=1437324 RepID=A0A8J2ZU67_9BACL|nr:gamma-glutamyl-gamma-aminobutyrate hydrolase family protein [Pullulanibacillus pueri]MBM7681297.1 putative glutamine amidotransferase [Pullulanibacillus pueri]GGH77695.1 peptidase C26 [Pullulanibacillus pueri]
MNKPLIALTADFEQNQYKIKEEYCLSILETGGLPVAVPYLTDTLSLQEILSKVDGLILTGGSDIDPALYGEEPAPSLGTIVPARDRFEIPLVQYALTLDLPILAICRGLLILNVAAGGSLYQDIYAEAGASLQHKQSAPRDHASHSIKVNKGTLLHRFTQTERLRINSFHHQAIKRIAPGFHLSAAAPDGIIEAIEHPQKNFTLGVQWHPGSLLQKDPSARRLFQGFIQAAMEYNASE